MISIEVDDILDAIDRLEQRIGKLDLGYKVLLMQDGTLEYALSIVSDQRVRFEVMKQIEFNNYIERHVRLVTNAYKVTAHTIIHKEALDEDILNDIREQRLGIGKIIRKHRLETFRNILEIGYNDNMLYRVYEIMHNGKVAFSIKEEIL